MVSQNYFLGVTKQNKGAPGEIMLLLGVSKYVCIFFECSYVFNSIVLRYSVLKTHLFFILLIKGQWVSKA